MPGFVHNALNKKTQAISGASLIEVAIGIIILGFLTVTAFMFVKIYHETKLQKQTLASLDSVEAALKNYRNINGRYPCPAPLTAPPDSAEYGKAADANCSTGFPAAGETFRTAGRGGQAIRFGAVPFKDLNIDERLAYDGGKKRIVYAVTEYYATTTPDFMKDRGAIKIVDAAGGNSTSVDGNIIYAFYSPGADSRGAYNYAGALMQPCDTAASACENCDFINGAGNGTMRANLNKQSDVGAGDFTHTLRYAASTVAYEWLTGNWSACACGSPDVTRTVSCHDKGTDSIVDESLCATAAKPEVTQSCTTFCWDPGPFGPCSCSTRTQARPMFCADNRGQRADNSLCTANVAAAPAPNPVSGQTPTRAPDLLQGIFSGGLGVTSANTAAGATTRPCVPTGCGGPVREPGGDGPDDSDGDGNRD